MPSPAVVGVVPEAAPSRHGRRRARPPLFYAPRCRFSFGVPTPARQRRERGVLHAEAAGGGSPSAPQSTRNRRHFHRALQKQPAVHAPGWACGTRSHLITLVVSSGSNDCCDRVGLSGFLAPQNASVVFVLPGGAAFQGHLRSVAGDGRNASLLRRRRHHHRFGSRRCFGDIAPFAVVPQAPVLRLCSRRRILGAPRPPDGDTRCFRGPRGGAERQLRKATTTVVVQAGGEGRWHVKAALRLQ